MPEALDDVIKSEEFKRLSPKAQQNIVMEYIQANPPGVKGPNSADIMKPESTPQSVANEREDSVYGADTGGSTFGQRVGGAGIGLATGGGSAMASGLGALLGGLMPPKTPGQMGAQALAGPLGGASAKVVNKIPNAAAKVGGAGLAGLLNMFGLNAANSGIDAGLNAAGTQNVPVGNPLEASLPQMALAAGGPMLGQTLISNLVKKSPLSQNAAAVNELTGGKKKPINTSELGSFFEGDQNASKELQDVTKAGATPNALESKNLASQKKIQDELDKIAVNKKKLTEKALDIKTDQTQNKIDFLRQKVEKETYGTPVTTTPSQLALTNTTKDLDKQGNVDWQKAKLDTQEQTLGKSLSKLQQETSDRSVALPPDLATLSSAKSPRELMQKIGEVSPEGVEAYRQHVETQLGQKGVTDLQDAFVDQFFKEAYNGNTKLMSNAQQLFYGNGQPGQVARYSPDKIRAIFGSQDAVEKFKKATDAINAIDPSNPANKSIFNTFAASTQKHLGWVLPNMVVFHPETALPSGALLGGTAAATYAAVTYPKIIKMFLQSPKTAESFYKWATGPDRSAASLKNWPRAAAWLKANSEPVEDQQ